MVACLNLCMHVVLVVQTPLEPQNPPLRRQLVPVGLPVKEAPRLHQEAGPHLQHSAG